MLRITKLIGKVDLFTLLSNPDVGKIELLNNQNKSLTNPNVCRVNIYLRINIDHICSIVGRCREAKATHKNWKKGNAAYVTGTCSILQEQFIKWSKVKRLKEIEKEEGLNFGIPAHFETMVAKYSHYIDG